MERKIYHGQLAPSDIAQALAGEFDQGNLRVQALGQPNRMIVQIGSRPQAISGGQTAITVTIERVEDGIMIELGQQAWLGVAASLGVSALAALRNPLSLLGRLDDIAQDIENMQLSEKVWQVIAQSVHAAGASTELSNRLKRMVCEYCGTANPLTETGCVACGAPLGKVHPSACRHCGFVVTRSEKICPNCKLTL